MLLRNMGSSAEVRGERVLLIEPGEPPDSDTVSKKRNTVVSGQLNVVKGLKRTNQIVGLERS
jgi:hypothetical protein